MGNIHKAIIGVWALLSGILCPLVGYMVFGVEGIAYGVGAAIPVYLIVAFSYVGLVYLPCEKLGLWIWEKALRDAWFDLVELVWETPQAQAEHLDQQYWEDKIAELEKQLTEAKSHNWAELDFTKPSKVRLPHGVSGEAYIRNMEYRMDYGGLPEIELTLVLLEKNREYKVGKALGASNIII